MFKNWQPLDGYDLVLDGGLIQYSNDASGDELQFQWLSFEPAIAVIDGVAVVDDSKETSIFRRIENLLRKADQTSTAFHRRPLNPLRLFLYSNELFAATGDHRKFIPAIFTVGDRTNTAEAFFARDSDTDGSFGAEGNLKKSGVLPGKTENLGFRVAEQELRCEAGGKLAPHSETIDGKPVQIRAVSRSVFVIQGYPTSEGTIRVTMAGESGAVDAGDVRVPVIGKNGKQAWSKPDKKGKRHRIFHWTVPCNGKFSNDINKRCATAWDDLSKDSRFADVKTFFDKIRVERGENALKEIKFGSADESSGLRCSSFYKKEAQLLQACLDFFRNVFPRHGRHFEEGEAKFETCEDKTAKKCSAATDEEVALEGTGKTAPRETSWYLEHEARRDYRNRVKGDPHLAADMKTESGLDKLCPNPSSNSHDFGPCKAPPKNARKETKDAYAKVKIGGERMWADVQGDSFREKIERRLFGEMMMGDCCESTACQAKLKEKYRIELKDRKSADQVK